VRVVAVDAAHHMIELASSNICRAGLAERIRVELADAKRLPHADGAFDAVISNSIVHHIPRPESVLAEMVRVTAPGGGLFVRDLVRPESDAALRHLVKQYASDANEHQRQMFADSLHAALTLDEIRELVKKLGFPPLGVQMTSDRHWTWAAVKA
jgi:ubiquinone/menaquinone biosynthesis C-methylase UbiE